MKIIYIAGNGHSGSTILAMLLGNDKSRFNAGEMNFITRPGILTELCSCGTTIGQCETWQRIMETWASSRQISFARYRELWSRFERNKTLPRLLFNMLWPSQNFRDYCAATLAFFEAIKEVTGVETIVDSSKSPARILVLRRISKPRVIHLCRNFTGILNSGLRFAPKNIERGVEADLHPTPPGRALLIWLSNNLIVSVLSIGIRRCVVHFRHLVTGQVDSLRELGCELNNSPEEPIFADHMFAGNSIRLRRNKLDPELGFRYSRLTPRQRRFGLFIDRVFWFWSR